MTHTRLRNPLTLLSLIAQNFEFLEQLGVQQLAVAGHDAPEQQSTKARRILGGQHGVANRDTSRGRDRPGVIDLEFGQDHDRAS